MGKLLSSVNSECLVLGGLILHMDWLIELGDLKVDYFSVDANRIIFGTLKRLYKGGSTTCDIMDIYAIIETNSKDLEKIEGYGGVDYISTLVELAEGKELGDIKSHSKIIVDCAYKNELSATLDGLKGFLGNNQNKPREYISRAVESELLDLKSKYTGIKRAEMINDKIDGIRKRLERISSSGFEGIPTSIPLLNKFCTYQAGEMIVIGGLAKFGKSQFVVDQSYWLAIKNKIPVMILDTELSTDKFVVRMVSRITGYSFKYISSGAYMKNKTALDRVEEAYELIKNSPISHTYIIDWSYDDIVNEVKRMKIQNNIQVLFYDYLKIEEVGGAVKEADQLGNLTNLLKNRIAGELNVAVVALAQTSDYSKFDGLRLANSQKIKNYASTVIYLSDKTNEQYSRDFNEFGGNVTLFISHNRNGAQMSSEDQSVGINLEFNKKNARIKQAQYQHQEIIDLAKDDDCDVEGGDSDG